MVKRRSTKSQPTLNALPPAWLPTSWVWDDYSWEKMTLTLGITVLRGYMANGNPAIVMAAVMMVIVPVLVIFLLAQRWIIAGIKCTGLRS
jgi:ABC-type glycerol-3-phosphate transport system permease component